MKADASPDRHDEPERDGLAALLRSWRAPAPPPGIEDGLRREFRRRRRSRPRVALWLSLAAALAVLATWQIGLRKQAAAPAATERHVAAAPSSLQPEPAAPKLEAEATPVSAPAAARSRRARAGQGPSRPEPAVIVEEGQAELLVELSQKLWEIRQAAAGTKVEAISAAHAPRYRAEWEAVAGVWPQFQRSVTGIGR
jgi:hypothetical protein